MTGFFKATEKKHPDDCVCHLDWDSHTKAFGRMKLDNLKTSHFLAVRYSEGKPTYVIGANDDAACRGQDVLKFTKLYANGEVVLRKSSNSNSTTMTVSSPRVVVKPAPLPAHTLTALVPYLPTKKTLASTDSTTPVVKRKRPQSAPQVVVVPRSGASCMDVIYLLILSLLIVTVMYMVIQTVHCKQTTQVDFRNRHKQLKYNDVTFERDCVTDDSYWSRFSSYFSDTSDCKHMEMLLDHEWEELQNNEMNRTPFEVCYVDPIKTAVFVPLAGWITYVYEMVFGTTVVTMLLKAVLRI
jgi:hypothetical protein